MNLHIGTSGWSYASWKPAFFPEKLPSKRFLEFYATRLNAVELNGTFRRMPTASAIAGWLGATPPDFRFAAKVHQSITHFKRLKDCDDAFRFFLQSMEPMRESGKLGPILIQTPPNLKVDIDLLQTFAQLLYEVLKSKNAALCWAESEKIVVPKVATADFVYYRFREPEYSTLDLQKVTEELKAQSTEREVYAFFKHEERPESALNAVTVARLNGIEEKPFVMPEKKARVLKPKPT
jgi:uncharacterized protein YecE (DUF72 family)